MVGMSQMADEERGSQERVSFQAWQCSFLPGLFLLIAVLPAQSQEVPVLNVEPVCRGIANKRQIHQRKVGLILHFRNAQRVRNKEPYLAGSSDFTNTNGFGPATMDLMPGNLPADRLMEKENVVLASNDRAVREPNCTR